MVTKIIFLSLGQGDISKGFPNVRVRLEDAGTLVMQEQGSLPAEPKLPNLHTNWQFLHETFYEHRKYCLRSPLAEGIEVEAGGITSFSEIQFRSLSDELQNCIRGWLNSEGFSDINQKLRTELDKDDEIEVIIETQDDQLQRLPWHFWQFIEDYSKAEPAFSAPTFNRQQQSWIQRDRPRILAVLGDRQGINTDVDEALLRQLDADFEFLEEPKLEVLTEHLRDEQGWDILFFAGHSSSREEYQISLNSNYSITINDLRYALKKAIGRGLRLAIFNSCDGIALARALSSLNLPLVIVMREPVPNQVAQDFLKYFLRNFAQGQALHTAVREARESLQGLERDFPCATWLPTIFRNPAEEPLTWQEMFKAVSSHAAQRLTPPTDRLQQELEAKTKLPVKTATKQFLSSLTRTSCGLKPALVVSVLVAGLLMGIRSFGILQGLELVALDQLMRLRPIPGPDERILVVEISDADVQEQILNNEAGQGSLHDPTLQKLIANLEKYQPRAIGIDIIRDQKITPGFSALATRLQQNPAPRIIAICEHARPDDSPPFPGIAKSPDIGTDYTGFNDLPFDADNVVRRFLLQMNLASSRCEASEAFSLKLAMLYLENKGVTKTFTQENFLQLGEVIFRPLEKRFGGYQNLDSKGHQVLLNYRPYKNLDDIAPNVPLKDVLEGRVSPEYIKNRIVLIGRNDIDLHATPYTAASGVYQEVPGVYIHAQMVSYILSTVLNQWPVLWAGPWWLDGLWVLTWSTVGGAIVWQVRRHNLHRVQLLVMGGVAVGFLYGCCFLLLVFQGVWLPVVPSVAAFLGTSLSLTILTSRRAAGLVEAISSS